MAQDRVGRCLRSVPDAFDDVLFGTMNLAEFGSLPARTPGLQRPGLCSHTFSKSPACVFHLFI